MKYLSRLFEQFMALKSRERFLAIAASLGVIYFLVDLTMLTPQLTRAKALRQTIAQQNAELAALSGVLKALTAPGRADPLDKLRAERDALRSSVAQAESATARASADAKTGEVIRAMVAATPGLTLVSLRTLPAELFFNAGAAAAAAPAAPAQAGASAGHSAAGTAPIPTLYKHGIELTVQGTYPALMSYLQALERNAVSSFWSSVKLDVISYPNATLKITIFNLSAHPALALG